MVAILSAMCEAVTGNHLECGTRMGTHTLNGTDLGVDFDDRKKKRSIAWASRIKAIKMSENLT